MLPFKTLIIIDRNSATPVYRQIANRLVSLIREGALEPGSALPGSREMAGLLKVHRKTIVAAYEELYTQDWIETIPRKGVLVSRHLPDVKPRSFRQTHQKGGYGGDTGFSLPDKRFPVTTSPEGTGAVRLILNDGFPDARIAPVEALLREYRSLFQRPSSRRAIMLGDPAGALHLRRAMAQFLSVTRGLQIGADHLMMTRGAQMAIYLAAGLVLQPGAAVIVGEPSYQAANMIFRHFGARLVPVPVDAEGIDVDAIARLCKKKRPDLLYIIPHHHHPTTVTLSAERRMKLLQLINEYNFPVIEDDYDYDFHYSSSPILPLAGAAHNGNVIYIGSVSKMMAPSVRMGYMVAPVALIQQAVQWRQLVDIRGDDLLEEAMAVLFDNGTIQRHLKKSLKLYHRRRDVLCKLIERELAGRISFQWPAGGMAVWARVHKKYPLPAIARRAAAKGLYMSDGRFYNSGQADYNALRIGFASLTESEAAAAVRILKELMR